MNGTSGMNDSNMTASRNESMQIDCFSPFMVITNGIWLSDDPLAYAFPLFLIQLLIISLTTRALHVIIKPLHQPMVMAEILAGVLLGPSVAGKFFKNFQARIFPPRSISTLSSMANVGLLYFVFMVGVEMDISQLKRMKKKVVGVGTISIAIPFAVTLSVAYLFRSYLLEERKNDAFYIYLAIALSVTSFPLLARILTELKLLSSEIGRISLLSSVINDVFSWVLLAIVIAFTGTGMQSHYILLSSMVFLLVCIFLVQPVLTWFVRKTPEGEPMSDMDLGIVIMGVMVAGFITDSIGIHCILGAFIYGLVFPHGPHSTALVERLEYFITGLLLPIYFATSGFKTDISNIQHLNVVAALTFIFVLSSIVKVVVTTLLSSYLNMPLADGLSLGFLMNSQGLADVILLNIAKDKDLIESETFAVMVVMSIVMTALMTPLVKVASKPMRQHAGYKCRTVMNTKPNDELRMLACVHSSSNASSVISLLDLANPTKQSPIFVTPLHLIELTGRESAMLIVHESSSKSSTSAESRISRGGSFHRKQAQAERIVTAFETYEQRAGGVSIHALTAIASYSTMHYDICTIAADNRVAIIVLPFDKLQTADGSMESDNLAIRAVNQNVLDRAPCSIAILVDRGLSTGSTTRYINPSTTHNVVLLFFGGPDDREALSIASRMVEHPNITLTMVRFIPNVDIVVPPRRSLSSNGNSELPRHSNVIDMGNLEADSDQVLDTECINEFQQRHMGKQSVKYMEVVAKSSEETVEAIKSINCIHDLYVVGRSQGKSPLTAGLLEWTECPELGPIGDLLASTDFGGMVSVLVVQQYTKARISRRDSDRCDDVEATVHPDAPEKLLHCHISNANLVSGNERRDWQRGV